MTSVAHLSSWRSLAVSRPSCAAAATAGDVEDFAGDNSLWLGEFSVVFQKMLAQGATGLQSLS